MSHAEADSEHDAKTLPRRAVKGLSSSYSVPASSTEAFCTRLQPKSLVCFGAGPSGQRQNPILQRLTGRSTFPLLLLRDCTSDVTHAQQQAADYPADSLNLDFCLVVRCVIFCIKKQGINQIKTL